MPSSRRFLYTAAATAIFLLLSTLIILLTSNNPLPTLTHQLQHHVCPAPTPPITRKFHSLTPSSTTSTPWESLLLPPNGGMLKVRTRNNTITDYGISMFHQLHCLTVLRGLIFPETSQHHGLSTSPSHSGDDHEDAVHWAHCFDYIAQVRYLSPYENTG